MIRGLRAMDLNPTPGIKTSEFKALVLYAAVVVANGTKYVSIEPEHMYILAGLIGGYTGARTWAKSNTVKSVVAAALNGKK